MHRELELEFLCIFSVFAVHNFVCVYRKTLCLNSKSVINYWTSSPRAVNCQTEQLGIELAEFKPKGRLRGPYPEESLEYGHLELRAVKLVSEKELGGSVKSSS